MPVHEKTIKKSERKRSEGIYTPFTTLFAFSLFKEKRGNRVRSLDFPTRNSNSKEFFRDFLKISKKSLL